MADELGAAQHVGPLVVAAELHVAAVVLEQVVEVVGLHDHIVELQEGQALLHALLIALGPEHVVHREAGAHVPQQVDIVELQQPVGVVHHLGLPLAELDEALHLLLEAVAVVLDGLGGHHTAHVGAAGGVADIAGAAADEGDGPVARHLQPLHQAQGHEVAHVEGVGGGVKADIENGLPLVDHLGDLLLVGHLGNQSAGFQFFVTGHRSYSFMLIFAPVQISRPTCGRPRCAAPTKKFLHRDFSPGAGQRPFRWGRSLESEKSFSIARALRLKGL